MRRVGMKRILLILLIILLIYIVISCVKSNKRINEKLSEDYNLSSEEKKILDSKYSCVKKKLLYTEEILNPKYEYITFMGAKKRIEEGWDGNSNTKNMKIHPYPILYLEILYINARNVDAIKPCDSNKKLSFEKTSYYLVMNEPNYSEFMVAVKISEGWNKEYFEMMYNRNISNTDKIKDIEKYGRSYESENDILFQKIPIYINANNFKGNNPRKEYYNAENLIIHEVDYIGNVKGKYGSEEFIIPVGKEWVSKEIRNEIPKSIFKYGWPEFKNGELIFDTKPTLYISAQKIEKDTKKIIVPPNGNEIKTNNEEILKYANNKELLNRNDFENILVIIEKENPNFKLNFMIDEWDEFSIVYFPKEHNLNSILPQKQNPIFITRIKVINHGWNLYYK